MTRKWLAAYRDKAGFSHEEVAEQAGISRQYYGMIENGDRNPSVDVAKKIAKVLKFDWIIFFDYQRNELLLKQERQVTKEAI